MMGLMILLFDAELGSGFGGVAQLGEHLLCKQGVIGSIPIVSTMGRLHQLHLVVSRNVRVRCDPMPGQSASGLIAPYALGFGPRVAAREGGVVLCYCESGSGASLGACDQDQSVRAGGDPVVRLDCLTGKVVVALQGKPCGP